MTRILFLFFTSLSLALPGQSYDAALGLRLGTDWGLTTQLRLPAVHKNFVVEGILQSDINESAGSLTVLGKQHRPLLSRRLNLFYGAGAHVGWNNEIDEDTGDEYGTPFGIDGVVGLEATVGKVNLAYDFKPAVNVGGGPGLELQSAFSIRYVIGKRNSIWDKKKEKAQRKNRRQRQRDKRKEARRREREKSGKRWYEVWKKG